ncbi:hypothetical protein BGZ73_001501 [Actinomortierella ambigua]|nr:hypothetical protein BGZ73_001501 [Actinomortierella ambigua]
MVAGRQIRATVPRDETINFIAYTENNITYDLAEAYVYVSPKEGSLVIPSTKDLMLIGDYDGAEIVCFWNPYPPCPYCKNTDHLKDGVSMELTTSDSDSDVDMSNESDNASTTPSQDLNRNTNHADIEGELGSITQQPTASPNEDSDVGNMSIMSDSIHDNEPIWSNISPITSTRTATKSTPKPRWTSIRIDIFDPADPAQNLDIKRLQVEEVYGGSVQQLAPCEDDGPTAESQTRKWRARRDDGTKLAERLKQVPAKEGVGGGT